VPCHIGLASSIIGPVIQLIHVNRSAEVIVLEMACSEQEVR
jgi:hypothetical protein